MFGVAVNHFQKPGHPASVQQSTRFALSLLKNCAEVTTVFVVDSSEKYDEGLANYCQTIGVNYRHYDRALAFAEAYNFGVACLDEEWVVTMASDIYVRPETFTLFKQFIEDNPQVPIGCLIPYLSNSDYWVQEASPNWPKPTCYCGIMTYNLNVFPKATFQRLGGLSDKYSGNFNDIETSIQLRSMGLKIVLVSNFVQHYGRLTLQHGLNGIDYSGDFDQFRHDHPSFVGHSGVLPIKLHKFLEHPVLKIAAILAGRAKSPRLRQGLDCWLYQRIAAFQRIGP